MKQKIITIIFLTILMPIQGQNANNTANKNVNNIYNLVLIKYLEQLEIKENQIPDTIFIEKFAPLTDSLLPSIGKTKLAILDLSEIEKKITYKGSITLYKLFPLEYKNREFKVALVPFGVTSSNEYELYFANNGTYWTYFKFRNAKFKFKRAIFFGI
jgi:hypothetical protein